MTAIPRHFAGVDFMQLALDVKYFLDEFGEPRRS